MPVLASSTVSPSLRIGLRLLGVWPGVSCLTVYLVIYLSSTLALQYFQYLYIFEHFRLDELSNLVDGLSASIDYSLTFLKVASLCLYRQ